jgi:hypothetical protein
MPVSSRLYTVSGEPPGVRETLQGVRKKTIHNGCCFSCDRHYFFKSENLIVAAFLIFHIHALLDSKFWSVCS